MRTAEETAIAAIEECALLGHKLHSGARVPMYRRIDRRQQQLFEQAGQWNEDFLGWSFEESLTAGNADLSSVLSDDHPTLPGVARITRVEISDKGSSAYTNGEEIAIVPVRDAEYTALPPRATMRSGRLLQVGTDLAGVAQVEVFYARKARPVNQGTDELEVPSPHDDLLVYDLAKHLLKGMPEDATAALAVLDAREAEALTSFRAYVERFAPTQTRFGRE